MPKLRKAPPQCLESEGVAPGPEGRGHPVATPGARGSETNRIQ